jgi:hypothetical protein
MTAWLEQGKGGHAINSITVNRTTSGSGDASAPARRWTTPQILHAALGAVTLGGLLLSLVAWAGVRQHRQAIKSVGQDAAPSIIAAQSIKSALADLDANVANELMVKPGQSAGSIASYAQRRQEIGATLIRAAENITYGDAERKPIRTLEVELGAYEVEAARARTLHERGDDPAALAAYGQAYRTLQETLLPAADELSRANTEALNHTYAQVNAGSVVMTILLLLVGASLTAVLLATQGFLSRRMRRTFNPLLLLATLLTLAVLALWIHAFRAATYQLKIAKEDAFTSILALWQARAVAYDANTDESRWLLDRPHARDYESAFFAKTARLLQLSGGQSYESVTAATRGDLPEGARGYFATELNNITFAGEREAAQEMVHTYGVYYADDRKIRELENAGRHEAAVAYCISMAHGDSNWAFDQFDRALGKTLDLNRHAFDFAVERGFGALNGMEILCPLAGLSIAALAFAGLRPRIREYQ